MVGRDLRNCNEESISAISRRAGRNFLRVWRRSWDRPCTRWAPQVSLAGTIFTETRVRAVAAVIVI